MVLSYVNSLDAGPFAAIKTSEGFILAVVGAGDIDSSGGAIAPGITGGAAQVNITPMIIPINQSQSEAKNFFGQMIFKFVFPAAWTTAALTFLESDQQNGTYTPVYTDSAEKSLTAAAASRIIRVVPDTYYGTTWLKLRSGVAATPVLQTAARTILVYSFVL